MGRSEQRALEHRVEILFNPSRDRRPGPGPSKSNAARQPRLLKQNPGLQPLLTDLIPESYESAWAMVERDTGIDERNFPTACPWTVEAILDEGFWPEAGSEVGQSP